MDASLVWTIVGSCAGVVGAISVTLPLIVRRKPAKDKAQISPAPPIPAGAHYDVFIAYSHQDRGWVRELVGNLQAKGVSVAYDELVIGPGNVVVHMLDEAIRASASGLLVYSRAAMASRWVAAEYAALMQQAIQDGQRFIPVLIEDVQLPPLAQSRSPADFSGIDAAGYDQLVSQIATAVTRSLLVCGIVIGLPAVRSADGTRLLTGGQPAGVRAPVQQFIDLAHDAGQHALRQGRQERGGVAASDELRDVSVGDVAHDVGDRDQVRAEPVDAHLQLQQLRGQ
jgi:TIR domain